MNYSSDTRGTGNLYIGEDIAFIPTAGGELGDYRALIARLGGRDHDMGL